MRTVTVLLVLGFLWSVGPTSGQECCCCEVQRINDPPLVPLRDEEPKRPKEPREEPRLRFRALLGGVAVASTDTDTSVEPFASIGVAADLTEWASRGPVFDMDIQLTGLPAETSPREFEKPRVFNAVELSASLCQRLPRPLMFGLCATFGAASRLATRSEPITRLPLFWTGEILFESKDGGHRFKVGIGPDQRLSGDWSPVLTVGGRFKVLRIERRGHHDPGGVFLVGSYVRSLDDGFVGFVDPPRDALRVGLAVGL